MDLICAAVADKSFNLRGIVQFEPPSSLHNYLTVFVFEIANIPSEKYLPQSRKVLWGFYIDKIRIPGTLLHAL